MTGVLETRVVRRDAVLAAPELVRHEVLRLQLVAAPAARDRAQHAVLRTVVRVKAMHLPRGGKKSSTLSFIFKRAQRYLHVQAFHLWR